MQWAADRETTCLEDVAYSLLGLFGVQMPLLYGEGPNAFIRLQQKIMDELDDCTLFLFSHTPSPKFSMLAATPNSWSEVSVDTTQGKMFMQGLPTKFLWSKHGVTFTAILKHYITNIHFLPLQRTSGSENSRVNGILIQATKWLSDISPDLSHKDAGSAYRRVSLDGSLHISMDLRRFRNLQSTQCSKIEVFKESAYLTSSMQLDLPCFRFINAEAGYTSKPHSTTQIVATIMSNGPDYTTVSPEKHIPPGPAISWTPILKMYRTITARSGFSNYQGTESRIFCLGFRIDSRHCPDVLAYQVFENRADTVATSTSAWPQSDVSIEFDAKRYLSQVSTWRPKPGDASEFKYQPLRLDHVNRPAQNGKYTESCRDSAMTGIGQSLFEGQKPTITCIELDDFGVAIFIANSKGTDLVFDFYRNDTRTIVPTPWLLEFSPYADDRDIDAKLCDMQKRRRLPPVNPAPIC